MSFMYDMRIYSYQPTYAYKPVSFTAMTKPQFSGIDLAVVEKYKAPIETFKSYINFNTWAEKEFTSVCEKDYGGRSLNVFYKRREMIEQWQNALVHDKRYSWQERLLIMKGITKDLKPKDDTICPVYNKKVLEQTVDELKTDLNTNRFHPFSFGEMYKTNLRNMYAESNKTDSNTTKWIVIPSEEHDPDNFSANIAKLQTLSCHEWCTKYGGAKMYLEDGDVHIFLERGKPKLAIRFDGDLIKEINGERNDYIIPKEYLDITTSYIKENDFVYSEKVDNDLRKSIRLAESSIDTVNPNETIESNSNNENGIITCLKKIFRITS